MKSLIKIAVISLLVMSCAQSVTRVALPADTNVKTAISEGERVLQKAYSDQWDVLAYEDLQKSANFLKTAKKYDSDGKNQEKVVEQLEYFQAYYKEAQSRATSRATKVQGLLTARETALNSGIHQKTKENDKFTSLDKDFRGLVEDRQIDVKEYADLQKRYLDLAALMKKNTALGTARRQVEESRTNRAASNAPNALNMAELDLKSAENMIDANQGKPEMYNDAIDKANRSAGLLAAIVSEQKAANYNLDENSARKLVQQKGLIAKMDADLAASKAQLNTSREDFLASQMALQTSEQAGSEKEKALSDKDKAMAEQSKLLTQAEADRKFQTALEAARQKFSAKEADVYRQGDKLLIRLKTVGFASGNAMLPENSKTILDKVTSVAKELSPKEIVVEGHTDSVGSAEVNDTLSKKRADTVATYLKDQGMEQAAFQAIGYGFQKPLSSNKTKEGRAQNRRVDIWITPENMRQSAAPTQDGTKTQ